MRELLQQALDALEWASDLNQIAVDSFTIRNAVTALHAALAQKEAEPVAWRIFDGEGGYDYRDEAPELFNIDWAARYGRKYEPLYATPQQAQPQSEPMLWVPPEREGEFHHDHSSVTGYRNRMAGWIPLYATPPVQPAPAVPNLVESHLIGTVHAAPAVPDACNAALREQVRELEAAQAYVIDQCDMRSEQIRALRAALTEARDTTSVWDVQSIARAALEATNG